MKSTIFSILAAATLSITGSQSFASPSVKNHAIFAKSTTSYKDILTVKGAEAKGEPTFKGSENFLKAFPNAMVKHYEITAEMTKVSFSWNGDALEAYYNDKGELLATNHFLDPQNLPLSIRMKVQNEYEGYAIAQATEFYHADNGLSYFLIVKNSEKGFIIRVTTNGEISELKKLKN